MIIRLSGGALDISDENVGISWESIRFSEGISDAFTSDIVIPATSENIRILNASGLLDSPNQKFGDYITPATLSMSGMPPMDVRLQVTGVTDDEINVTLYEATIPTEFYDKKLTDIFTDTQDTIWVWSTNTYGNEPAWFKPYYYGMSYSGWRAQYHPVKKLNSIIDDINTTSGYTLPHTDDDLFMMASKKFVCPQNPTQVVEWFRSTGTDFNLVGGQHVVNDVEGVDNNTKVMEGGTTQIKFNRHCNAHIRFWWSFRVTASAPTHRVTVYKNGDFLTSFALSTAYWLHDMGVGTTIDTTFEAGDVLTMTCPETLGLKANDVFMLATYNDYEIDENDYGTELLYRGNHPALHWFPTNNLADAENMWFDYRTWTKEVGVDSISHETVYRSIFLPYLGFTYFGYWANVPEISVKDLLYGLCFYMNKKVRTQNYNVEFVDPDTAVEIEGIVTDKQPVSDKLGRTNIIKWLGDDPNPLRIEFNNRFLSDSVTLHESPFAYVGGQNNPIGTIPRAVVPQYKLEQDSNGDWQVKYDEVEGLVLVRYATDRWGRYYMGQPASLTDLGIGKLNTVMQCTIETFSNVFGYDYVYLDGRKYMVISGDRDAETGLTTLETLLMSTSVPDKWNIIIIGTITGIAMTECNTPTVYWRDSSNVKTKKKLVVYRQGDTEIPKVTIDTLDSSSKEIKGSFSVVEGNEGVGAIYAEYDVTDNDGSFELSELPDGMYRISLTSITDDDRYSSTSSDVYYNMANTCGQAQPEMPKVSFTERTELCSSDIEKRISEAASEKRYHYLGIADMSINSTDTNAQILYRFVDETLDIDGSHIFNNIDVKEWLPYNNPVPFNFYVIENTQDFGSYKIQAKAVGVNGVESEIQDVIFSGHEPTNC